MKNSRTSILLIGIGNIGRKDDGLGWLFLDSFKKHNVPNLEFKYNYQLNIEDAEAISEYNTVIFVDAYNEELENGFSLEPCIPKDSFEFTTHALNPGVVVSLCGNIYGKYPQSYVLKIQGKEWGLQEGISMEANRNLHRAIDYFLKELPDDFTPSDT